MVIPVLPDSHVASATQSFQDDDDYQRRQNYSYGNDHDFDGERCERTCRTPSVRLVDRTQQERCNDDRRDRISHLNRNNNNDRLVELFEFHVSFDYALLALLFH